jgi:hypothetical protein
MLQPDASLETNPQNNNLEGSTSSSQQQTQKADAGNKPEKLSLRDLFLETDDGEIRESDDSESDPNAPIDSLDRVIKKLGITPEQAYKIKIPMRDGQEPVALGELKDRIGEVVDLETRELQFDQNRREREGELLRAQSEIRELMQLIPRDQLKPELIEKVRNQHESTMRRERQLTVEHIPEWRNEAARTADLEGMAELVQEYGFPEAFITTVVDHRALKMLRDFYRMNKRIKEALAKVKTPTSKGQRPSGKNGKGPINPDRSNSNSTRRNGAVPTQRQRLEKLFNSSESK